MARQNKRRSRRRRYSISPADYAHSAEQLRTRVLILAAIVLLSLSNLSVNSLSSTGTTRGIRSNLAQQHPIEHNILTSTRSSRRNFLQITRVILIGSIGSTCIPFEARSADEQPTTISSDRDDKPFAPREALLPAARCKIWIDQAYKVGSTLSTTIDKNTQYNVLKELDSVLSNRPNLFLANEKLLPRSSSRMTAQITTSVSAANRQDSRRNRADLSLPNQLAAMLNQADVERQWGMLQSGEAQREQGNGIRAALNYYTQRLTFGDSYRLTAAKEDKKRMIRNDELPSLTTVITSDLDLRDLYRNQLLTAVDDWQAEVAYQSKRTIEEVDTADVIDLMNQSYTALSKWFALIAPADVQEALEVVRNE